MMIFRDLLLFLIAWILILPLTFLNMIFVIIKYRKIDGYFKSTALSLDIWGNVEFRTLWNSTLRTKNGYDFGKQGETISSALGKNQRDKTLTNLGKILVFILDTIDKNHCQKSIK